MKSLACYAMKFRFCPENRNSIEIFKQRSNNHHQVNILDQHAANHCIEGRNATEEVIVIQVRAKEGLD